MPEFLTQTNVVNRSLFWIAPKGSMIDFGSKKADEPAFADLRDFKVPPLFKM
jgi:hypothetical protein